MRKRSLISAALCTALLAGALVPAGQAQAAEALTTSLDAEHAAIHKPAVDFERYIHQASEDSFDFRPYMVDMTSDYGQAFDGARPLTLAQAEEDLDVLFRSLATTYGAYYYFGGDEVFEAAHQAILQDLRQAEELTCNYLVSRLLDHLTFITDGHFRIVGMAVQEPVVAYHYTQAAFTKTAAGYENLADGRVVAQVDGWTDLDQLIKRSLADDGQLIYRPIVLGALDPSGHALPAPLTVRYTDQSSEVLQAQPYRSYYDKSDRQIEVTRQDGIPVLFVRNMGFDEAKNDVIGRAFLAQARALRDEPALIVDLRSNGGGNSVLPLKWLAAYTGRFVPTNTVGLQYWTMDDMLAYTENKDNVFYVSYDSMTKIDGQEPVSDSYMKTGDQPDAFVPNDRLLIILTGKNTASAAETFVDAAHNVANTIIIGENTYGMLTSNAYTVIALPNSHTPIQFGSSLTLFPENEGYFQEFTGFAPDIWTQGGDALDLAVKLVKSIEQQ